MYPIAPRRRSAALALLALGGVAAALCVSPARAQTVYFGQDSPRDGLVNSRAAYSAFTASLTSFFTNDLESVGGANPTLAFGTSGILAQTSGPNAEIAVNGESGSNGFIVPTSGRRFFANRSESQMTFTLNAPVTAFGLFAIDAGTLAAAPPADLFFLLQNTQTGAEKFVFATENGQRGVTNNVIFFGVNDFGNPFDRITVGGGASAIRANGQTAFDGISYDDITVGAAAPTGNQAIPEPGSLALLAPVALGALGVVRRRRRAA